MDSSVSSLYSSQDLLRDGQGSHGSDEHIAKEPEVLNLLAVTGHISPVHTNTFPLTLKFSSNLATSFTQDVSLT